MPASKRKPIRLTLGGVMVLVACLAVFPARQAGTARQQREAVAAVKRHGGWVHYDYEMVKGVPKPGRRPWGPRWLHRILGDEYFQTLVYANFDSDEIAPGRPQNKDDRPCDDALAALSSQHGMKYLVLSKGQISDEGLSQISGLIGLEQLSLRDAEQITDSGLQHIGKLVGLKTLYVESPRVTDRGLLALSRLSNLTFLSVRSNRITDAGLPAIANMKDLWWLCIGGDRGPRSGITDQGMALIGRMEELESLILSNTNITDDGVRHLRGLAKLRSLDLDHSRVGDRGLAYLEDCRNIQHLSLSETAVTDAGLVHLNGLSKLRFLNLRKTPCSDEAKHDLKALMPALMTIY